MSNHRNKMWYDFHNTSANSFTFLATFYVIFKVERALKKCAEYKEIVCCIKFWNFCKSRKKFGDVFISLIAKCIHTQSLRKGWKMKLPQLCVKDTGSAIIFIKYFRSHIIRITFIPKYIIDTIYIRLWKIKLNVHFSLHLTIKAYSDIICKYPFVKKKPIEKQK